MTGMIPTGDAAVIFLADALNRERGLTEQESRVLSRAVNRRQRKFRRWTAQEDGRLMKMHRSRLGGAHIAEVLDRSEDSVRVRICRLKKQERVR